VTRVDFHVLEDRDRQAAWRYACRLALRALSQQRRVFVYVADAEAAAELDELMWHYPERRFLPHGQQGTEAAGAPVCIGWQEPAQEDDVLINLTDAVPGFFGRFDRLFEVVVEDTKVASRERYRFYQQRGFPIDSTDVRNWEAP